jgi:hypothetical protein
MNRTQHPLARSRRERGIALIVVLSMVVLLTLLVAFAMTVSNRDGAQAGKRIHNMTVQNVAEGGLQYARAFFSVNYLQWNTYLALTYPPLKANNPELFPAVPSGYSCYVYARDDADELPPAIANAARDNNFLIYIGASCTGPGNTSAELSAPLIWDPSRVSYTAQSSGGTHGISNYRGAGNAASY